MILRPCLCMYNTFVSHFDPFRLSKIGKFTHAVGLGSNPGQAEFEDW